MKEGFLRGDQRGGGCRSHSHIQLSTHNFTTTAPANGRPAVTHPPPCTHTPTTIPPTHRPGKSGNINNVLKQLYGASEGRVPGRELVCVFDADQVASREFFLKTVPLFDGGDDVGMVLSPQVS